MGEGTVGNETGFYELTLVYSFFTFFKHMFMHRDRQLGNWMKGIYCTHN